MKKLINVKFLFLIICVLSFTTLFGYSCVVDDAPSLRDSYMSAYIEEEPPMLLSTNYFDENIEETQESKDEETIKEDLEQNVEVFEIEE